MSSSSSFFRHALPSSRLGRRHETLGSFKRARDKGQQQQQNDEQGGSRNHDSGGGGGADTSSSSTSDGGHHQQQENHHTNQSTVGADPSNGQEVKNNKTQNNTIRRKKKEYTLVVVTENTCERRSRRILLGLKKRGFGKGFYNGFGGKLESDEIPAKGARRELQEETGINVTTLNMMERSRVGTLHFTFDDSDTEMIVYLFRLRVTTEACAATTDYPQTTSNGGGNSNGIDNYDDNVIEIDPSTIRGCDEIEPRWFTETDIPLHQMFADDSIWLTKLLRHDSQRKGSRLRLDGWFHFHPGGQDINSIMHYYVDEKIVVVEPNHTNSNGSSLLATTSTKGDGARHNAESSHIVNGHHHLNLEESLFRDLKLSKANSPTAKEFTEAFAFCSALKLKKNGGNNYDVVIDVAGGHGALAAIVMIACPSVRRGVVVDPARVNGQVGVSKAWHRHLRNRELRYRHECLRTGLPAEIDAAVFGSGERAVAPERVLVVACHACQHMSDEILEICLNRGVAVVVMPCCQKDPTPGQPWKATAKNLGIPVAKAMDLLLAGKCLSWNVGVDDGITYDVRMRVVAHASVTPQNRMIYCRPVVDNGDDNENGGDAGRTCRRRRHRRQQVSQAHRKLELAYKRAHVNAKTNENEDSTLNCWRWDWIRNRGNTTKSMLSQNAVIYFAAGFGVGIAVAAAASLAASNRRHPFSR